MIDDPVRLHRRSIRLPEYDYAQAGAYFVTIVARQGECLLGEIISGQVQLSPTGQFVQREWQRLPGRFPGIELDEFVIMPNHIHGIIIIHDPHRGAAEPGQDHGLDIIPLRPYTAPRTNVVPGSLGPSRAPSNPPQPTATTARVFPADPPSGSAIITNTSSGTTPI